MLSLQNITKIYTRKQSQEDVVALDNVSIDLPDKGFVAILGASGSGKTTLLNIIGGLDKATSGNMIVDGLSTNEFASKDWDSYRNQKIGFVLQNCYLLSHLNVRDNVAVKLQISHSSYKDIDALVDDALKRVDLLDKKYDKPKALSGGQKQRVAIARALVGDPTVILADEPTGALDSKTGTSIMELLKEASKDHLVVMVTHNNEYASKYADRVIELKDGQVVNDSAPVKNEMTSSPRALGKVSIPPETTLKWGFKNLIVKKFSTLSIIVAAALGLAGVGIILSVSTGVQHVFDEVEASSFSKYPVQFRTSANNTPQATGEDYEEFTDEENVYVDYSSYYLQEHFEYMSDEFLAYMRSMPESYYIGTFEVAYTTFNMYTKRNDSSYPKVSSTYLFYKGTDNVNFMETQYDCLKGSFPKESNELALVVDRCNRVNVSYLYYLGFDVDTSQILDASYTFDEILSKTYKYVPNNDYYEYDNNTGRYLVTSKTNKQLYDSSTVTLKISGIIRQKKDNNDPIISTGVIYSPAFEDFVLDNANHSDVVVAQKANKTTNVNTGAAFADTATKTAEYYYEQQLYQLGCLEQVNRLNYFTKDYESRVKIKEYFKAYHYDKDVEPCYVSPYDYLESASQKFDGALSLMTSVLYVFAVVTVVVSALLNGILTFISIRQRTNEIGLLRSLGARKMDIATMVETESLICGIFGGLFSILISMILIAPINALVTRAIRDYKFYLIYDKKFSLEGYQWWVAPICIGIGVATALISALIPAILASRKDPAKAINE